MPTIIPIVGANRTFSEDATSLNGKEDLLLELNSDGTVKLNTGDAPIGVHVAKLQNGQPEVNVRLLGQGGSLRVIQSAAIAVGAYVMVDPDAPTKVKTYAASAGLNKRVLGRKLADSSTTANGAAGDVIEISDSPDRHADTATTLTQTQAALTDSSGGSANTTIAAITNAANAGSADVGPVKDAIADLAAQLEAARVDFAALKTILDARGITAAA
jgi:hypothetical protein